MKDKKIRALIAILCVVVVAILYVSLPFKAQAVVGVDDAVLLGILTTIVGTAAGLSFTALSNDVAGTINNPISNNDMSTIFTSPQSLISSTLLNMGYNSASAYLSDIGSNINWDEVFSYDASGELICELDVSVTDGITALLNEMTQALGASSPTSVDFDINTGNILSNTSFSIGGISATYFDSEYHGYVWMDENNYSWNVSISPKTYVTRDYSRGDGGGRVLLVSAYNYPYSSKFQSIGTNKYSRGQFANGLYYTYYYNLSATQMILKYSTGGNNLNSTRAYFANAVIDMPINDPDVNGYGNYESMDYTIAPDIGVEELKYPQDVVSDYPNVESIPYVVTGIPALDNPAIPGTVPLVDVIPSILEGAGSNTLTADITDDTTDIPDNPDDPGGGGGSGDIPLVGVGLDSIFPFCIPFDIYHFFEALAADPVAPHFEWRMYVDGLVDYTFTIDLEQFNTVAQILRTMELLAFCVGLAFVTRSLIRG